MTPILGGYRIDLENQAAILRDSTPLPATFRGTYSAPLEINPDWCRIENQREMGSCQGHAQSSVTEMAFWIANAGQVTQFSPMFAYLSTQRIDGLLGRDNGSTIDGGRRSAMEFGECPLEVFPYPNPVHYSQKFPPGADDAAAKFKIQRYTAIRSYQDGFTFLSSGQGGILIGINWPDSWMDCEGVIEYFQAGAGGGHSVCFLGYSKKTDQNGEHYWWLVNSWGTEWGNRGKAEVSPSAVRQMLQHRDTVMVGLSDMATAKPRSFHWKGAAA